MNTRTCCAVCSIFLFGIGAWSCGGGEPERLEKKAAAGDAAAQYELGRRYADGRGGVKQDPATAAKWIQQAAKQDHIGAAYLLGGMYADGLGVAHSDAEAARWYQRAAQSGHPAAPYELGVLYEEGRGVRQNLREAYIWYSIAAAGSLRKHATGPARIEARTSASARLGKLTIDLGAEQVRAAKQEAARRLRKILEG